MKRAGWWVEKWAIFDITPEELTSLGIIRLV